jgi:TolA-binding protein
MKPLRQQQQQQMRQQQDQMRERQEQLRRRQMGAAWTEQEKRQREQSIQPLIGAAWLRQQSAQPLERPWDRQPTYAVEGRPSCVARLAKDALYLLAIGVILVVAYVCVTAFFARSF